jgi:putative membrane protein
VRIVLKLFVSAIVIAVAPQVMHDIQVASFGAALWAAIVYGVLSVVIGWLAILLAVLMSIVPGILTFGLFFLLVPWIANAMLLKLTAGLLTSFYIGSWSSAFLLSLILSVAHVLVDPDRGRRLRRRVQD